MPIVAWYVTPRACAILVVHNKEPGKKRRGRKNSISLRTTSHFSVHVCRCQRGVLLYFDNGVLSHFCCLFIPSRHTRGATTASPDFHGMAAREGIKITDWVEKQASLFRAGGWEAGGQCAETSRDKWLRGRGADSQ